MKIGITFGSTRYADSAELLPTLNRTDGLNVKYTARNMVEAHKIFELLELVAAGTAHLSANLKYQVRITYIARVD